MSVIVAHDLIYRPARCPRDLLNIKKLHLEAGKFHALIGANGAGKSTLLRALSGDLPQFATQVAFAGQKVASLCPLDLAKQRAILPQTAEVAFSISVREVVAFGRNVYHHQEAAQYDQMMIDEALHLLAIAHLQDANYQSLSGGEQHRTHLARTLAQLLTAPDVDLKGKIWFLDEPTNHLDIKHQYALMALLERLKQRGLTIVCVLHDLALALNYADSLFLLQEGREVGHFTSLALVEAGALDQAYELTMNAHFSAAYQRFVVMPALKK